MPVHKKVDPTHFPPPVQPASDQPEPGLQFDRLPESARRWQRFGSEMAARHAEAVTLRREIDAVAGKVAAWIAAEQHNLPRRTLQRTEEQDGIQEERQDREAVLQLTWVHLRRAGLALRAEIDRHEIKRQERDRPGTDQSQLARPTPMFDADA